jgi:uncharacterized Zn finger protein (UPF0148 family)
MKKRKNLHTSFIKFLLEKYSEEIRELPQQEPEDAIEQEPEDETPKKKQLEPSPDEEDEEIDEIQELIKEYKRLEKRHENNWLFNRRRG